MGTHRIIQILCNLGACFEFQNASIASAKKDPIFVVFPRASNANDLNYETFTLQIFLARSPSKPNKNGRGEKSLFKGELLLMQEILHQLKW